MGKSFTQQAIEQPTGPLAPFPVVDSEGRTWAVDAQLLGVDGLYALDDALGPVNAVPEVLRHRRDRYVWRAWAAKLKVEEQTRRNNDAGIAIWARHLFCALERLAEVPAD